VTKEIPQFRTCPICKCAKLKSEVQYDVRLDGKDVKICGACAFKHGLRTGRRLLQEEAAKFEFGTNV